MRHLAVVLAALAPAVDIERVTTGPGGGNEATYTELLVSSDDGRRAIFETYAAMTPDDVHSSFDFYAREGSTTTLQTRFGGPPPTYHERFFAASADARRVVFDAMGKWTQDDTDAASDVARAHHVAAQLWTRAFNDLNAKSLW